MWKRLNILRKKNKNIFGVLPAFLCVLAITLLGSGCNASAEISGGSVRISASYSNIYSRDMTMDLGIDFSKYKNYNENLYISYHIYDAKTGECVIYDNERKILDKKPNQSKLLVSMDISIPKEIANRKLYITYDVLDLNDEVWLSQNEGMIESDVTYYEKSIGKGVGQKIKREVCSRPVIFLINVFVFVATVVLIIITKKKKIYE